MAFLFDDPSAPATAPGARNFSRFETAFMGPGQAGPMQIDPTILAQLLGNRGQPPERPLPFPWQSPEINRVPRVHSVGMPHRRRVLPQIHSLRGHSAPMASPLQALLQQALNPAPESEPGTFNLHQHNSRGIAQAMGLAHNLQSQRQMSRLLKRFVGR